MREHRHAALKAAAADADVQTGRFVTAVTAMHTPNSPAIEPEVLEMLESLQEPGEPDLIVEIVSIFLRDTPERLDGLRDRPLDPAHTSRVAHAVKGSAGNLGASHLQALAERLEAAGIGRAEPHVLASLADAVMAEYARVADHLQGVLAQRGA